jgi:hypothetical protein
MFTFLRLKDALQSCTGYDLIQRSDDDGEKEYFLIDPCGDQDGEPFYSLDDVADYICNDQQVEEYLTQLTAA